jgi:hypothetical protein
VVTEPLRFGGASGSVGLGVEVEDHVLALELREIEWLTLVVFNVDRRRGVAFFEGFGHR